MIPAYEEITDLPQSDTANNTLHIYELAGPVGAYEFAEPVDNYENTSANNRWLVALKRTMDLVSLELVIFCVFGCLESSLL